MSRHFQQIGVIGGGAWGTALAQSLGHSGRKVTLWAFETECVERINETRENSLYLPGITLSDNIKATSNLSDLSTAELILAVSPAQHMRHTLRAFAHYAKDDLPIVLCSKGIEHSSLAFMADVLRETIPAARCAVLSGPSFAIDVARGLPTAVTLACTDKAVGEKIADSLAAPTFRPYWADDIIGAEIGGAVKNVLAIVCGIVIGKGLGKSAHAAIIARGYREMSRLGEALGADPKTLTGLCGLGDLVLTCSSEQSRNMSCGLALGKGESLESIMNARAAVTEGVATAPALKTLATQHQVDMPICRAMADILAGEISVDTAIADLLSRNLTSELE